MRTIATHILIAFALAGVIVGPLAMAADCPRTGPVAVTCANDHKLLQSQQRDTTIVFQNATKVLKADGTSTVLATDICSNVANGIPCLDGNIMLNVRGLKLNGSTSGTVTHDVAATTASYALRDPSTASGAGQAIVYPSGGGQGTWVTPLDSTTGANVNLSNLASPTAINQALIPSGTRNLGASGTPWSILYASNLRIGTAIAGVFPASISSDGSAAFGGGAVRVDASGVLADGTVEAGGAISGSNLTALGHGIADMLLPSGGVCSAGQVLTYLSAGAPTCVTNGTGTGIGCSGTCSSSSWAVFTDSTHVTNAGFTPEVSGAASTVQGNLNTHAALTTTAHGGLLAPNAVSCAGKTKVSATNGQITSCTDATASDVGALAPNGFTGTANRVQFTNGQVVASLGDGPSIAYQNVDVGPSGITYTTAPATWTTIISRTITGGNSSQKLIVRATATLQQNSATAQPCSLQVALGGTLTGSLGAATATVDNFVNVSAVASFAGSASSQAIAIQMYAPAGYCTAYVNYAAMEITTYQY